ncbi:Gfo/Idh/MocA family oxidoreductase [Oscillibacter sp.]|uniref:Gfo/Idh/MocA family protein n=1 Tax=Oscillibacter sp. TaxID=1945593 RepID=UPI00289E3ACA|nr:Gfo/Idh/MocA family oxidoreductase [Oscillibacter sp.]
MTKIRLGILGTSEIAFRRFLPALSKCDELEYVGVASRNIEKTKPFVETFGGKGYSSYEELLADKSIDAIYIPLPPALHYEWGKKALESGKHILMEKPFTTSAKETVELLKLAEKKSLAVHENYMFLYHSQLVTIQKMLADGDIGELRLIRATFGFPKRDANDFRYNKALGGGALLDCGGYPIRLSAELLGDTAKIKASALQYSPEFEVDIGGSATLQNDRGQVAQIAFGMDNSYKCELEVWGSIGCIFTNRIFTAPMGYAPQLVLKKWNEKQTLTLLEDDSFVNSIRLFSSCIQTAFEGEKNRERICRQAVQMNQFMRGAER